MKIFDLIIELEETLKDYGNIEVYISVSSDNGRLTGRVEETELERVEFNGKLRNVLEIKD